MKNIVLLVSAVAIATGVSIGYYLKKNCDAKKIKTKVNTEVEYNEESENENNTNLTVTELFNDTSFEKDVKGESINSIYDRHLESANIIKKSFEKIYNKSEPIDITEEEDKVINIEEIEFNNKMDSISRELDELI